MKFPLLSVEGSKSDSIEISDKLVKAKVNHKLIKFVIDWQLNHAKPRTAKLNKEMKLKVQQKKLFHKKAVVEQGMRVEKHHYLLEEESHMVQKEQFIKLKKLIKK